MIIWQSLLAIIHGVLAIALIGLILIQHGKGADTGASFGGGASGTVFGSTGSGNFLTRMTSILAVFFLINCLALAWMGKQQVQRGSLLDTIPTTITQEEDDQDGNTVEAAESGADIQLQESTDSSNESSSNIEDTIETDDRSNDIPALPPDNN